MSGKTRVAIIGTGKIGIDLLYKVQKSNELSCDLVLGRTLTSEGLKLAQQLGAKTSVEGISAIIDYADKIDIVFDATSALSHKEHWHKLQGTDIRAIDMTPSKVGQPIVPAVNIDDAINSQNVNMVSCGGQSSIPIVAAVSEVVEKVDYIEIVSSIASKSAGPATRINLDEYVATTEEAVTKFSGASKSKVILILNPATPPVYMQTTISFKIESPPMNEILRSVKQRAKLIKSYVPGYEVVIWPKLVEPDRVMVMIKVAGSGDYLPQYAGNLDIINCAAVAVAERIARENK
ncbi:MAG: acetaldehyde dehydrogenase (acetylating) [Rhodospirillaceae bacterium]